MADSISSKPLAPVDASAFLTTGALATPAPAGSPTATSLPAVAPAAGTAASKFQAFLASQNAAPVAPGAVIAPSAAATLSAGKNFETLRDETMSDVKTRNLMGEAEKIAAAVDFTNLLSIGTSGVEIQHQVTAIDEGLVARARNDKTGAVGSIIREIQAKVASFDRTLKLPDPNAHHESGLFDGLTHLFHKGADAVVDVKDAATAVIGDYWNRYQPVADQIAALAHKLQEVEIVIIRDEAGVKLAQEASSEAVDAFTVHNAGLILALDNLRKNVLPKVEAEQPAHVVLMYKNAEAALDARIREIFEQRTFGEQQVASAGMMRVSGAQAAQRLIKVRENIIPLFYRLAYQEVVLFTQREGIKLSEEIVAGFNSMMLQSAKNLGLAYVEAAKANSSELISSETLKETAEIFAGALHEAYDIAHGDFERNQVAEGHLQEARQIMEGALRDIKAGGGLPGKDTPALRDLRN